ncbi:mitochondrial intermembrane space import and assembly protein 40 [Podospora aff. communis PSN243]|uniref:Mitochondrial intermembrane space import and assembly protein 40 n=1 Tax=Podospora aff. communis PSN243 TaxID=3040156 RepID=A0AAV9GHT2_9PEZI|nr:mitochondrial intermembrane space import and assembly protein 40 [Podospora aff. communis PSN243]
MYRTALRSSPGALRAIRPTTLASASRRFVSTSAAAKKGTWKGTGLRWALAIGAIYFYNTSPIFADELPPQSVPAPAPFSDADQPTIDALIEEKRKQAKAAAPTVPAPDAPTETTEKTETAAELAATSESTVTGGAAPEPGSPEALEQEAEQQGAFNPETGEINWDCPCLGGMAHGPCGEEFKAAFSCFVYSTEEPKGMDCIEKFQGMQDCFRQYPEIYGAEIADADEEGESSAPEADVPLAKEGSDSSASFTSNSEQSELVAAPVTPAVPVAEAKKEAGEEKKEEQELPEIPKKAHDATEANKGKEQ